MLTQVLHGNCRTLSLATIVSKLLEHYILSCISLFPATTKNQFGFKSEHDADLCVFLLKQLLQYYVNKSTKVFAAVLAGSKAFYRTKHNLLFTKLMYLCVYLCAMYLCVQ